MGVKKAKTKILFRHASAVFHREAAVSSDGGGTGAEGGGGGGGVYEDPKGPGSPNSEGAQPTPNAGSGLVWFSCSSEYPVDRYFGEEVLSHEPGAVDLSRFQSNAAVRDGHWGDLVGAIKASRLMNKRLEVGVQFGLSERAQLIEAEALAGIRTGISIGYVPRHAVLVESSSNEAGTATSERYLVDDWMPYHVAFEPDPADPSVGVGRGRADETEYEFEMETRELPAKEVHKMSVTEVGTQSADAGAELRRQEDHTILQRCSENGIPMETGLAWVRGGMSLPTAMEKILESVRSAQPTQASPSPEQIHAGMEALTENFSFARALLKLSEGERLDGCEGETCAELRNRMGGFRAPTGTYFPTRTGKNKMPIEEVIRRSRNRALDSKTTGTGAELATDGRPMDLIEALVNKARVIQLGARVMSGLQGNVPIPRINSLSSVTWVGENPSSGPSDSDVATGYVNLTPHTAMITTGYTKQLLAQSSLDVEGIVRDEIATQMAVGVDRAAIHGLGSNNEPMGVFGTPNVGSVNFGATIPTWSLIVSMTGTAEDANAPDGVAGFLTTPLMAAKLASTAQVSGQPVYIWQGNVRQGSMAGFPAWSSSNVSKVMSALAATGGSEHGIIFSPAWSEMIVADWGVVDLLVDPYSAKKLAKIEVTGTALIDIGIRHEASFVVSNTAKIV